MSSSNFRLAVFALVAVLLQASVSPADIPFDKFASSAPLDGEVFVLVSTNSGRCLTVKESSKDAGAHVVQGAFAASVGRTERWKVVRNGDYYKLVNENSGKVLAVPTSSKEKGTQIIQWDDAGIEDQQWEFVKVGNHYSLKSRVSELVLAVSEARKDEGAPVIQWEMAKIPDQTWYIQWVPGLGKK